MATKYQKVSIDNDNEGTSRQISDLQESFGIEPINQRRLPYSADGVFANISAKPETDQLKETPPTYEEAAADASPPYWQTTVITLADTGDAILVEGLPVGGVFSFFWNILVSSSFQFIGFMLTFVLHTSHASKQGSIAGLGITLIQTGFYIRSRDTLDNDDYYHITEASDENYTKDIHTNVDIIAYFFMLFGWFVIIHSLAQYFRAKQMEKIICVEPTPEEVV